MNTDVKLNTKSAEDLEVKYESGKFDHCDFCKNQVPLSKRPIMEEIVEQNSTPAQIQAWNQQWPRFGPGGALGRAFQFEQTRLPIIHQKCQIQHVETAWEMHKKGGARLLEKISDTRNEKKSKDYFLGKDFKSSSAQVDPSYLTVFDTCPDTLTFNSLNYIHLNLKTKNMTPIFLWSELHFLNFPDIFADGTFSVCRNIQNSSNTKTFSYPFMKFLIKTGLKKIMNKF